MSIMQMTEPNNVHCVDDISKIKQEFTLIWEKSIFKAW